MNSEYCNLVTGVPSIPINRGPGDFGRKLKKLERLLTGQISVLETGLIIYLIVGDPQCL